MSSFHCDTGWSVLAMFKWKRLATEISTLMAQFRQMHVNVTRYSCIINHKNVPHTRKSHFGYPPLLYRNVRIYSRHFLPVCVSQTTVRKPTQRLPTKPARQIRTIVRWRKKASVSSLHIHKTHKIGNNTINAKFVLLYVSTFWTFVLWRFVENVRHVQDF